MKRTLRLLTATLIVLGFVLFLACTPACAENAFASAKERLAHQFRNSVKANGFGNNDGYSNGQVSGNAKNIIFMVPDGLAISNVTAARIYKNGPNGDMLYMEMFPEIGYQRTHSANSTVTDSAAAQGNSRAWSMIPLKDVR